MTMAAPRFDLGQVAVSPTADEALATSIEDLVILLNRHVSGDWRELDDLAKTVNEHAIAEGGRILTRHTLSNGQRLYICTESTRQGAVTTVVTDRR